MSKPRVSILIPTYNGAPYISQCLESAIAQTFSDIEILVVDDGSSDNTIDIVRKYSVHDCRFRVVVNNENLGLVSNWNRCVQLARGEWLKFLFQDDFLAPNCVQRMLSENDGRKRLLTVCRREFVFSSVPNGVVAEYEKFTGRLSPNNVFGGRVNVLAHEFCLATLEHGTANFLGEPTAVLIHSDAFAQHGLFNRDMIQLCDLEYWCRLGVADGIAYVPETLAHFRLHGSSTTSANSTGRRFRKDVIDPLLLCAEFAFSPSYEDLRRVATSIGRDLTAEFESQLIGAQRWGSDARSTEWEAALASFPQLRLSLAQRLRKTLRHGLDDLIGMR